MPKEIKPDAKLKNETPCRHNTLVARPNEKNEMGYECLECGHKLMFRPAAVYFGKE